MNVLLSVATGLLINALVILLVLMATYYMILLVMYAIDRTTDHEDKLVISSDWIPFNYKKSKHPEDNFENYKQFKEKFIKLGFVFSLIAFVVTTGKLLSDDDD
jgi:hypothetical protein